MHKPLIILSPPRSFSSVVSTIIGEHPQLYGFPELQLFKGGDTVEGILQRSYKGNRIRYAPPGLLRVLAQEHDGVQTTRTILRAIAWLDQRRDWSIKALYDYLLDIVSPKIGVEKSPITASTRRSLERAYSLYPNAYFLHLVRHPVSARKSIIEFAQENIIRQDGTDASKRSLQSSLDALFLWCDMHTNIINFTKTLPVGQTMRIKGEDLLSEPEVYLPQITQWMGLQTDGHALERMMHPENSPYACVGPENARGGNDPKFMRSPKMRRGRVKEPSLEKFFEDNPALEWIGSEALEKMDAAAELFVSDNFRKDITKLAHVFGYQ